jgi:hypothetical protein
MVTVPSDKATRSNEADQTSTSIANGDSNQEKQQPLKWWQDPTTITLLVAIVAAVPPITTGVQGYIQAKNQQKLENKKHLHAVRQEYLKHVLSEKQNRRVLEFLVAVEDDANLRSWAQSELNKTKSRIEELQTRYATKKDLYSETIQLVSRLAHSDRPIDPNSQDYKRFLQLYEGDLISVESVEVEGLMVALRREFEKSISQNIPPGEAAKEHSFKLALTMKEELRAEAEK